jgi:hypothetical protein
VSGPWFAGGSVAIGRRVASYSIPGHSGYGRWAFPIPCTLDA